MALTMQTNTWLLSPISLTSGLSGSWGPAQAAQHIQTTVCQRADKAGSCSAGDHHISRAVQHWGSDAQITSDDTRIPRAVVCPFMEGEMKSAWNRYIFYVAVLSLLRDLRSIILSGYTRMLLHIAPTSLTKSLLTISDVSHQKSLSEFSWTRVAPLNSILHLTWARNSLLISVYTKKRLYLTSMKEWLIRNLCFRRREERKGKSHRSHNMWCQENTTSLIMTILSNS